MGPESAIFAHAAGAYMPSTAASSWRSATRRAEIDDCFRGRSLEFHHLTNVQNRDKLYWRASESRNRDDKRISLISSFFKMFASF